MIEVCIPLAMVVLLFLVEECMGVDHSLHEL
jgi:hypothetical protein